MSRVVQEKFQIVEPQNHNDDSESGWSTDAAARRAKAGYRTRSDRGLYERYGSGLNDLPPGMNIEDQNLADIHPQALSRGNLGNGDQVTTDVTVESLREGFDRKPLRPTDDMYSNEHADAFYDDVTVDGVTSYVERNNMLDRS